MTSRQSQRVEVLVAGTAIDATAVRQSPELHQQALASARSMFGSAICCCSSPRLPLVIRERAGKLFLAAWPDQANRHALHCPFFSEPRGEGHPAAGLVVDGGDRNTVHLHRALRKPNRIAGYSGSSPAQHELNVQEASGRGFHLWGALHYMWEEAGLNRWSPGWHRDWGFVRHALRRVAQHTYVGNDPLITSLYVPPVWTEKRREETINHWREFVAPLHEHHRGAPVVACGLVIGSVRRMDPSKHGYALRLHHHAEVFYMDQKMADIMAQYSRRGWSAVKHLDPAVDGDEKAYVVAALRIEASRGARMVVTEGVLMRVSPRYIPVNSSYEDRLARVLVEQDRQFVRPLHYDRHAASLPNFVLRDAGSGKRESVALYVYGTSVGPTKKIALEKVDREAAMSQGMGYWKWDVGLQAQPPPLPPPFLDPRN